MNNDRQSFFSTPVWTVLYIILQCTWGFLQSFLGLCLFLIHFRQPHDFYHGSIRTKWPAFNGISLGLFIFTPDKERSVLASHTVTEKNKLRENCDRIAVHEFGHTYQSLILGPLYLFTVGITSLIWSRSKRYQSKRKVEGIAYSSLWTEKWANHLGETILKQPSIRH